MTNLAGMNLAPNFVPPSFAFLFIPFPSPPAAKKVFELFTNSRLVDAVTEIA